MQLNRYRSVVVDRVPKTPDPDGEPNISLEKHHAEHRNVELHVNPLSAVCALLASLCAWPNRCVCLCFLAAPHESMKA